MCCGSTCTATQCARSSLPNTDPLQLFQLKHHSIYIFVQFKIYIDELFWISRINTCSFKTRYSFAHRISFVEKVSQFIKCNFSCAHLFSSFQWSEKRQNKHLYTVRSVTCYRKEYYVIIFAVITDMERNVACLIVQYEENGVMTKWFDTIL